MSRAIPCALALAIGACTVPKRGGFDDVERLIAERAPSRLRWNQGGAEDREVAGAIGELLRKDLTVASATEVALLGNPRLQATYERLGVAQADLVQAGLLRNPTLSGGVGFPITGALAWDASITQPFLDLFLIPLRKRFARAQLQRVKLEVADAVLELSAEVRAAFYMVQAAQQITELRRTIAEAAQASAELSARQHDAGNASDLELASEQGLYVQARLDLARAEAQVLAERERLNRLLGVWGHRVEWKIGAPLAELPKEEPPLEHLESFAVEHRLDLAAAREELNIVAGELSVTSGSRFIGAIDAGAHTDNDPEGSHNVGPTLSLELPIFDQRQAQVARLRARARQAQRTVDALAIEIRSEVRAARDRVLANRALVDYYRTTLVPLRERIVALSQQQYNAMLLGVYQLLMAKQNEVNGYREYLESVRDYWIARSDLERAAGGRIPDQGVKP